MKSFLVDLGWTAVFVVFLVVASVAILSGAGR